VRWNGHSRTGHRNDQFDGGNPWVYGSITLTSNEAPAGMSADASVFVYAFSLLWFFY
jgi:hypothetical protein